MKSHLAWMTLLVTDPVKDTMPQQRDKRKVARLRVVRGNPKEVERAAMVVQQARMSEVIDTESKVVQESMLALLGTEADSRKTEQTLGGVYGGRRVSRAFEKVEKTKHERRCHWEVGTKGWEPGQGQTLHSIHGETIEHDLAEKMISTSPSTTCTRSVANMQGCVGHGRGTSEVYAHWIQHPTGSCLLAYSHEPPPQHRISAFLGDI